MDASKQVCGGRRTGNDRNNDGGDEGAEKGYTS